MQIIEISEPGKLDTQEEIIVGIDFGTTNSLIAVVSKNSQPIVLGTISSVIVYDHDKHDFIISNDRTKSGTISSVKRLLAKSYEDIKSNDVLDKIISDFPLVDSHIPKINLDHKDYSFPELAAKIFLHLKELAEKKLDTSIKKAVVSVPAYFGEASRGAIMLAAKIAGFEVLRLIAEPTAAAYAYGFQTKSEGSYMVYDFGGGTFDVSILNMQEGILQVIATGGDDLLGGDDLDNVIGAYLAKKLNKKLDATLINMAKELKEKCLDLTNDDSLSIISMEVFNKLIAPIIDSTIKIAQDTLEDASIILDGIVLVGGSSRIPLIKTKLFNVFNVPIFSDINPDNAVAIGAALQANSLGSNSNGSLLIDVIPLSIGLELYGGIVEKIIMRNTPIPFSVTKNFTTHVDNQTGIQFHIVQGEREMVADCRSIGYFELNNIPPMKAGKAKIQVIFAIDADGILSITAIEVESRIAQNIYIKPSYGMNEKEVNDLLEKAFKNAQEDYRNRLLVQTKIDAENLILGINNAIKETPEVLSNSEKTSITIGIEELKSSLDANNRDNILHYMQELNKMAISFVQKHLNQGANLVLKGKHINDV